MDSVKSALSDEAPRNPVGEVVEVTFDGIYRPEMHGRHWLAIAYVEREGGQRFRSVHGAWQKMQMQPVTFSTNADAQAKCDELNTRLMEKVKG